jgi:hypothetical protein
MHNCTTTKIDNTPCVDISGKASERNEQTKLTWCPGYQIGTIILSLYKKQPEKTNISIEVQQHNAHTAK